MRDCSRVQFQVLKAYQDAALADKTENPDQAGKKMGDSFRYVNILRQLWEKQVVEIETELKKSQQEFGPKHPKVKLLHQELATLRKTLAQQQALQESQAVAQRLAQTASGQKVDKNKNSFMRTELAGLLEAEKQLAAQGGKKWNAAIEQLRKRSAQLQTQLALTESIDIENLQAKRLKEMLEMKYRLDAARQAVAQADGSNAKTKGAKSESRPIEERLNNLENKVDRIVGMLEKLVDAMAEKK